METKIHPLLRVFTPVLLTKTGIGRYDREMKNRKRMRSPALLVVLAGALFYGGCLTHPREYAEPLPDLEIGLYARDPVVRSVLAKDLGLREALHPGDAVLSVETEITKSQADVGRNLGLSLASGTTLALLSVSADIRFELSLGRLAFPSKAFSARGRTGRYVFLPIYAGFIATVLGSAFEDFPRPEELVLRCQQGSASACDDYRRLLLSAYDEVRPEMRLWLLQQNRGTK